MKGKEREERNGAEWSTRSRMERVSSCLPFHPSLPSLSLLLCSHTRLYCFVPSQYQFSIPLHTVVIKVWCTHVLIKVGVVPVLRRGVFIVERKRLRQMLLQPFALVGEGEERGKSGSIEVVTRVKE